MRAIRSSRLGKAGAAVVTALSGLAIATCSGSPAPVSVSSVYEIISAPAADTSAPVVAEIKPGDAQGELRFVVIPPGQGVR